MIPADLQSYYRLHSKIYDATRWAFLFGRNHLHQFFPTLPDKPAILDFGCGTGKQLRFLAQTYPEGSITGIDQSPEMLSIAQGKVSDAIKLIQNDYNSASFPPDSFDLIVASYSLSMVSDLPATLNTLSNHLKPNGFIAAVDFDATPFRWFNRWMDKNHVHFDDRLFHSLDETFKTQKIITKKAYLGLYTYSFFVGKKL